MLLSAIKNTPLALNRAQQADIPTHCLPHQNYSTRQAFEIALCKKIDVYQPALVLLAGFMRQLGPETVAHYKHRMINIHPSLLPKYPGLQTHQKVLKNNDDYHGASIHFVTEALDAGPLICQASFKINPRDDLNTLKQKVQHIEHKLYPIVLNWFAEGRITEKDAEILFNGEALPQQGINIDLKNH